MREIKITIPEGWWFKFTCVVALFLVILVVFPFYTSWLSRFQAETEVQARRILGECK